MKYILGSDSITVFHNGKPYTINRQAETFSMVLDAIKSKNVDKLEEALDIKKKIVKSLQKVNGLTIDGNSIKFNDREITGLIASRILESIRLGLDITPMTKFIENLMKNPSKRAVDELFGFMEACELPVTEDGHFLAYKRVRDDYRDVHSGTLDNSVGKVLQMERNLVDEDRHNTCSYGLHFCSYSYLKHFGGERIVVLKINPADVVAIPADYNNAKGRTCRYEVVDELVVGTDSLPVEKIEANATKKYGTIQPTVTNKNITGAKITEDNVIEIRNLFGEGYFTIEELMEEYKLSRRQVKRIINRESWKHVV